MINENSGKTALSAAIKEIFSVDAIIKLLIAAVIFYNPFIPLGVNNGIRSSIVLVIITLLALAVFDALRKNNTLVPYAVFIILLLLFVPLERWNFFRHTTLFPSVLFTLTSIPVFIAGSEANRITKAKGKPFFAVVLLIFTVSFSLTATNDFFIRIMRGTGPMPHPLLYLEDFLNIAVFLFFLLFMYSPYFVAKGEFLHGFLKSAVFSVRHFVYSLFISAIPVFFSIIYVLLLKGWNRYAVNAGNNDLLAFQARISGITDLIVFTALLLVIFDSVIVKASDG